MSIKLGSADKSRNYYVGTNQVQKIYLGESGIYEPLVTSGLAIHIDASYSDSYPGNGTAITGLNTVGSRVDATLDGDWSGDIFGGSWELNNPANQNEEINFGDLSQFDLDDFTFSIWFKFLQLGTDSDIFTKGNHSTFRPILCWYDVDVSASLPEVGAGNSNAISFMVSDNTSDNSNMHWIASPSDSIVTGQVYNLTVQHNTSGLSRMWINGALVAEDTKSTVTGPYNNSNHLRIGDPDGGTQDSSMQVYAFHAYTGFLSSGQIVQNYNHLEGRFEDS